MFCQFLLPCFLAKKIIIRPNFDCSRLFKLFFLISTVYCIVFCCMYDFLLPLCVEIKITIILGTVCIDCSCCFQHYFSNGQRNVHYVNSGGNVFNRTCFIRKFSDHVSYIGISDFCTADPVDNGAIATYEPNLVLIYELLAKTVASITVWWPKMWFNPGM